ncbi:MAG: LysM peptidoglycan-binding domain-containing protein [Ghiorsea sp.]
MKQTSNTPSGNHLKITPTLSNTEASSPLLTTNVNADFYSTVQRSVFLQDVREKDLEIIAKEARRATLPNWDTIDQRAKRTRLRVKQALNEIHAPEELLFVPVAESGYNPFALSPTGALGLWQLMPLTAIELGAVHRHGLDGRRHVEQSTKAAATYFLRLHDRFNSWPLALCAYNLGPWGVQRRLNKQPWQPEMGLDALPFPAETRHYVKQILGIILLLEQGELQFSEPIKTGSYHIEPPIDLNHLESVAGLDKNELFRFNPKLDYQHYLKRSITLNLPQDNIDLIEQALSEDPDIFKPKFMTKKIKTGDSLWKIARHHHTNIAYLRKLNPSLKSTLSIGHHIKVPASKSFATAVHKPNPLLTSGRRIRYKVKSGDSLWTIAKRFGTSTKAIARINQISAGKLLRPGDKLWIVAHFQPS